MSFEKGRNYNFPMDKSLFEEELKDYILASRTEHVGQQTYFYNLFDDAFIKLNSEEREYIIGLANGVLQNVLNSQEVASEFYRSDKEGWAEFTTNVGDRKSENPKALRIADRTTLKEVFTNAQDYQDMIGWSSFRFGRDAQKLPKFDMDRFYEKSGEKPTLVISPLFVTVTFSKTAAWKEAFEMKSKAGNVTFRDMVELLTGSTGRPILSTRFSISSTDPETNETYEARLSLTDSPRKFLSDLQDAKQEEIEEKGVFSGEWLEEPNIKLTGKGATDFTSSKQGSIYVMEDAEPKSIAVNTNHPDYQKVMKSLTYENIFDDNTFLFSDEKDLKYTFSIPATAVWSGFVDDEYVKKLLEPNEDINKVVTNKFTFTIHRPKAADLDEIEVKESSIEFLKDKLNKTLQNMVVKSKYNYKTVATWTGLPFTRGSLRASEKFQLHLDRLKERLFDLEELGFDVKGGE